MKEYLLNARNLQATHYNPNNGDHVLEFYACSMGIYATVRGLGPIEDPDYWDSEENFQAAIASVDNEDIDVYVTLAGGKAVKIEDNEKPL